MTARDIYDGVLMELNKVHAPALTVEEFVYFLNKAILAFTNERYNFYAVNQQLSDDLRVLVSSWEHVLITNDLISDDIEGVPYILHKIDIDDYLHILSCDFIVQNTISELTKRYTAKRMTLDMYGAIYNNEYLKPAIHRPYFLLLPTLDDNESTDDMQNTPTIRLFIGDAVSKVVPYAIRIFYLRKPAIVSLTDDDVYNLTSDASSKLEFPDYLKNEFVKRVAWYQLEETRDTRAQTFPSLNQEILTVPLELMGGAPQQQTQQTQ